MKNDKIQIIVSLSTFDIFQSKKNSFFFTDNMGFISDYDRDIFRVAEYVLCKNIYSIVGTTVVLFIFTASFEFTKKCEVLMYCSMVTYLTLKTMRETLNGVTPSKMRENESEGIKKFAVAKIKVDKDTLIGNAFMIEIVIVLASLAFLQLKISSYIDDVKLGMAPASMMSMFIMSLVWNWRVLILSVQNWKLTVFTCFLLWICNIVGLIMIFLGIFITVPFGMLLVSATFFHMHKKDFQM